MGKDAKQTTVKDVMTKSVISVDASINVNEAAKMMGLDPESLCRRSAIPFMNCLVKELNPDLQYELEKFRTGQDDFCQESIVLIK